MAKKILLGALALVLLFLGGRGLVRLLASDETKIRWLVVQMEEGYNRGKAGTCVGPLAKDWSHAGYALDRDMLLAGLFREARERDRETNALRSRVEVDEDALVITLEEGSEPARATLGTEATFLRLRAGKWEESWHMRIEAQLEERDEGWKIVKSRHEDLAGTQLGR